MGSRSLSPSGGEESEIHRRHEPPVLHERVLRASRGQAQDRALFPARLADPVEPGKIAAIGQADLGLDGEDGAAGFHQEVDLLPVAGPPERDLDLPGPVTEPAEDFPEDVGLEERSGHGTVPQGIGIPPSPDPGGEDGIEEIEFRALDEPLGPAGYCIFRIVLGQIFFGRNWKSVGFAANLPELVGNEGDVDRISQRLRSIMDDSARQAADDPQPFDTPRKPEKPGARIP